MIEKPVKIEINCMTGEELIIPLSDEEIHQAQLEQTKIEQEKAAADAAATAAAEAKASGLAKLLALGLTEAEANALIK